MSKTEAIRQIKMQIYFKTLPELHLAALLAIRYHTPRTEGHVQRWITCRQLRTG